MHICRRDSYLVLAYLVIKSKYSGKLLWEFLWVNIPQPAKSMNWDTDHNLGYRAMLLQQDDKCKYNINNIRLNKRTIMPKVRYVARGNPSSLKTGGLWLWHLCVFGPEYSQHKAEYVQKRWGICEDFDMENWQKDKELFGHVLTDQQLVSNLFC